MESVEIIFLIVIGIVCGFISCLIAEKLIRDRVDPLEFKNGGLKYVRPYARYMWALAMGAVVFGVGWATNSYFTFVEYIIVLCIAACIAIVDFRIQKIPNQLLLLLILLKLVSTVTAICSEGFSVGLVTGPIIGFVFAFAVYFAPGFLGLNIGAGDIKYGAVIGLYFGLLGFLQVMVVMGITMVLYYLFLRIAKKGGMRTMVPSGPFMSLGVMTACIFPVLQSNFSGALPIL